MNAAPPSPLTMLRVGLHRNGYRPVPVSDPNPLYSTAGKAPFMKDWLKKAALADEADVARWTTTRPRDGNTGLLCGELVGLDLDVPVPEMAEQVACLADTTLGITPLHRIGKAPKVLRCYRAAAPMTKMETPELLLENGTVVQVEVMGVGQQIVAYGIHPGTGRPYEWQQQGPDTIPLTDLPLVGEDALRGFLAAAEAIFRAAGGLTKKEREEREKPSPQARPTRRRQQLGIKSDRHGFFPAVNAAALADIGAWLPAIFPRAQHQPGTGAWRVTSAELGRDLEEDLSIHPAEGGQDFGTRQSCSPIDVVMQHGGAGTARDAAFWLCEKLGHEPATLGWKERPDRTTRGDSAGEADAASGDTRPLIRIAAGQLDRLATRAEAVLRTSGRPVFQRGPMLVRPIAMDVPASRGRMTVSAGLTTLTPPAMLDLYSQVARWERYDKRSEDWVAADPPALVAAVHLSRAGQWTLPPVAGVVTTPTLRPDGSVLTAPGYDAATRLYHVPDPALHLVMPAGEPTRAEAEAALALLEGLLAAFPFVSEVDRAVALSMLLTPVARGAMAVAPLHAAKASTAGTGKSYLVDLASAITTGRPCPVAAAAETAEETEKRLVGLLLSAFPIVSLDNVNGELGGDVLCQAVERPLIRVRPLGRSDIIEIESRACIFATGNALRVRGDMVRRSLVCTLDANMERPELREFASDPVAEVVANCGRYVGACLTIVRAYLAAGCPGLLPPLASFEDWSGTVRSALVWLGKADPCQSMEAAREDDPELTELREVLALWVQQFGQEGRTARDAAEEASARAPTRIGEPTDFAAPELRDALLRIAGDRGVINTRRLGKWLLDHEGRIVSRMRIRRDGNAQGGAVRWSVRAT